MKTIIATLFATAALVGVAQAEQVSGVLQSFDQVTGTIVLDDGKAFAVDLSDDEDSVIRPIPTGSTVLLTIDDGTKLVTDIRAAS
jgi:hypothetical protein